MHAGLDPVPACTTSISHVLSDDPEMVQSVGDVVNAFFGDMLEDE
jgi:hypothetical protein